MKIYDTDPDTSRGLEPGAKLSFFYREMGVRVPRQLSLYVLGSTKKDAIERTHLAGLTEIKANWLRVGQGNITQMLQNSGILDDGCVYVHDRSFGVNVPLLRLDGTKVSLAGYMNHTTFLAA